MAPHSSTPAWRIPWTEELGGHGVAESDTTEQIHFHFSLSCIGEGNGNRLQCSCLKSPRDGRAWWAAVSGVAQSQTWLERLSVVIFNEVISKTNIHARCSKITADSDSSHKIKRRFLLKRRAMTNLDSILKSRHHCLQRSYSQSYGYSKSHVGIWELDHKEAWAPKK